MLFHTNFLHWLSKSWFFSCLKAVANCSRFAKYILDASFLTFPIYLTDQHLYPIINNFLLQKPCLDTKEIPLLLPMLNSSNLQYSNERAWILKLLLSGLRSAADYYIYKRRHVFELLMSLYDSPLSDNSCKVCCGCCTVCDSYCLFVTLFQFDQQYLAIPTSIVKKARLPMRFRVLSVWSHIYQK